MGFVCLTTAWIIRVASVGATAQDWRPITDRPTDAELGSDESGHRSAIGTADVDIEPVVQVVHSVGSIRFGRLSLREPTTVIVALRDAVVRSVPELGSGCRYRSGRGQVERHPHALRDPRGVGDRFCAGAEDRIPATSSSGPPGLGWIGGPLGPRERGLRHPQGPLSKGTVRRRSAPGCEDDCVWLN